MTPPIGTQLSLLFLALSGAALREVGEAGFELGSEFKWKGFQLACTMALLQCVPIGIIWLKKRKRKSKGASKRK